MCRFGVPLAPTRRTARRAVGRRGARGSRERAGIVVVAGMFVPADEDGRRVTNTLIADGPGVDAHYDKIHLYDAFGFTESRTVAPGREPVVITVDGVARRADALLRHPLPRALRRAGAGAAPQLITVHASWGTGPGKLEQWTLLARARAIDTGSFVAAVGQAYPGDEIAALGPTGVGGSVVASPLGEVRRRRRAPTRRCSSPISTRCRARRSATRSRCCATAQTSLMRIRQNRGGD